MHTETHGGGRRRLALKRRRCHGRARTAPRAARALRGPRICLEWVGGARRTQCQRETGRQCQREFHPWPPRSAKSVLTLSPLRVTSNAEIKYEVVALSSRESIIIPSFLKHQRVIDLQ